MKRFIPYLFITILVVSCTDSGLDSIESTEREQSISAIESSVKFDAKQRCDLFRPNVVLATKRNYQLEVLESNSDFINHIYLVQGGTATFLATDDNTGTIVNLPSTRPGRELIFEIRVHDPDGNPIGDIWQSGPASRNADGGVHAIVDRCNRNQYIIRFEDIPATGWTAPDEPNYVDAIFRLF